MERDKALDNQLIDRIDELIDLEAEREYKQEVNGLGDVENVGEFIEIWSRPITLEDVLLAMSRILAAPFVWEQNIRGFITLWDNDEMIVQWKLGKDLLSQSERNKESI